MDPFGLPPAWERARQRSDQPLSAVQIWVFRLCLLTYPVLALAALGKFHSWGGLGGAITPLFMLSLMPTAQRRQILRRRSNQRL
jgi:hypothetical protein